MIEKPNIDDKHILNCLHDVYGLPVNSVEFLPLGADYNTAVYRAETRNKVAYFVKLRRGEFDEMTITVPKLLHDQDIKGVIAPIATESQDLWADLDDYKLVVFPFVNGYDGYNIDLLDQNWIECGKILWAIHTAGIPSSIMNQIQRETYSDEWRVQVKQFQVRIEKETFDDPIASTLAHFLKSKTSRIDELVRRAEKLASVLREQSNPLVLCHADLHAGNILIDTQGMLFVVDWDTMILAPKERDLMYVGGGQFMNKRTPQQEISLFYKGYEDTDIDLIALAYYRYERIVQDIVAYCDEILLTVGDSEDRKVGLRQLMNQFNPNNVIDIAFQTDINSY